MHVSDGESESGSESGPLNLREYVKTDRCPFVVTKYVAICILASMLNFKKERLVN